MKFLYAVHSKAALPRRIDTCLFAHDHDHPVPNAPLLLRLFHATRTLNLTPSPAREEGDAFEILVRSFCSRVGFLRNGWLEPKGGSFPSQASWWGMRACSVQTRQSRFLHSPLTGCAFGAHIDDARITRYVGGRSSPHYLLAAAVANPKPRP